MAISPGTYTISGTVTDTSGNSAPFTAQAVVVASPPAINSVTVSPASAPAGTLRTITINATDPQGQALTYSCSIPGVTVTQTSTPNVFTAVL